MSVAAELRWPPPNQRGREGEKGEWRKRERYGKDILLLRRPGQEKERLDIVGNGTLLECWGLVTSLFLRLKEPEVLTGVQLVINQLGDILEIALHQSFHHQLWQKNKQTGSRNWKEHINDHFECWKYCFFWSFFWYLLFIIAIISMPLFSLLHKIAGWL